MIKTWNRHTQEGYSSHYSIINENPPNAFPQSKALDRDETFPLYKPLSCTSIDLGHKSEMSSSSECQS